MSSDIYEKTLRIRSEHVNRLRYLRTSSLFRFLQEASIAHTTRLGFGRDKTLDKGLLWILSRQEVTIRKMPSYDDEITIRSWPGNMLHVFFPRFYEIWMNGECVISGEALWLLMDEKTRTMAWPAEEGILIPGIPNCPPSSITSAIRAPQDAHTAFSSLYRARFSQTDLNGHVGNANYFDIIDDLLPESTVLSGAPSLVRAEYLTEIKPSETLKIRGFTTDGSAFYTEGVDIDTPDDAEPSKRPHFRVYEEFL